MIVRPLTLQDMPELLSRVLDAGNESGWTTRLQFDAEHTASYLAMMIESDEYLVIGHDDVGSILIAKVGGSWFSPSIEASELIVYVHPEVRKTGRARELVKEYIDWAKEKGAARIKIGVSMNINPNEVAHLYESMGFGQSGFIFTHREGM